MVNSTETETDTPHVSENKPNSLISVTDQHKNELHSEGQASNNVELKNETKYE